MPYIHAFIFAKEPYKRDDLRVDRGIRLIVSSRQRFKGHAYIYKARAYVYIPYIHAFVYIPYIYAFIYILYVDAFIYIHYIDAFIYIPYIDAFIYIHYIDAFIYIPYIDAFIYIHYTSILDQADMHDQVCVCHMCVCYICVCRVCVGHMTWPIPVPWLIHVSHFICVSLTFTNRCDVSHATLQRAAREDSLKFWKLMCTRQELYHP